MGEYRLLQGDCLDVLPTLEAGSVHCCVTSPPYFGLRDYGTAEWEGGDAECDHRQYLGGNGEASAKQVTSAGTQKYNYRNTCGKCGATRTDSQIGLEESPEAYVAKLVQVFREVRRVLRDDGTVWLNLGDSYASNPASGGKTPRMDGGEYFNTPRRPYTRPEGLKPKDLIGIPWRVAFALQADGWWLRQDIIWHKPNPMPESVTDRCTKAHEYIFLLTKSARYYYDAEAVREDATSDRPDMRLKGVRTGLAYIQQVKIPNNSIVNSNKPVIRSSEIDTAGVSTTTRNRRSVWTVATKPFTGSHFATFPPALIEPCILAGCPIGGVVLDPFGGAGTTGLVALSHGRNAILCELNPEYVKMARKRIDEKHGTAGLPMFAEVGEEAIS